MTNKHNCPPLAPKLENSFPTVPGGFTVLMAVYKADSPSKFELAVKSVYANTLLPDAFQLVVDGPIPNGLMSKVKELQRQFKMNVIFLPKNMGLAFALNRGIENIKTTWIARADADDINLPRRFEILASQISEDVDIVGSAIRELDEHGLPTGFRVPPLSGEDIRKCIKRRNPFNHMTVMYRTQLIKEFNGYPEVYLREDYALWAILLAAGSKALNVSEPLVDVTAGEGLIRRRGGLKYAIGELRLQRHLVKNHIKGFWCAVLDGFIRGSIFCLPISARLLIYRMFLRN